MSMSRPLLALPTLVAAAVLLAGCTGSPAPSTSDATSSSPLEEYLGAIYGGGGTPEEQQARLAEEQKKREEVVASCMKEKGFEYTPDLQGAISSLSAGDDVWNPDDREWVSQWGYGAVDSPGRDEQGDPTTTWVDPNADYLDTLSESEKTAFTEALWGRGSTDTSTGASTAEGSDEAPVWDWKTAGCQGAAQHEVSGENPLTTDEFAPLLAAINELWQQASTYPGMPEADRDWVACMDDAGYPGFTSQPDAAQSIHSEVSELWNAQGAGSSAEPGEPDPAALAEVKEKEIALALADLDCREKTDYSARADKARRDAESAFVTAHKAELDALKAAAAQAQS